MLTFIIRLIIMFCTTVYTVFIMHNSCIEYFLTKISNQSPPDLKLGLDLGSGYRVKAMVKIRKYFHWPGGLVTQ